MQQLTESTCSISDLVKVPDPFLSKQLRQQIFIFNGLAHFKASMICPSWLSSSTILLIMSSRFGSFNTPVAFGSTWIVKSFTKDNYLIKVQRNHLQLILCWVEAELPEDVSQKFCLHLPTGRGVKLFESFLKSFRFSTQRLSIKPDIEKSVHHN